MKLAVLAVVLGLATTAAADPYSGPPGNYDEPAPTEVVRQAPRHPGNGALRQAIIARFDRDGDGRLSPQERRRAVRALRRLAKRLAQEQRRERRMQRQQPIQGDVDIDIDIR